MIKLDVEQPTRGLSVELEYGGVNISDVRLLEFFPSSNRARINRTAEAVPTRAVRADFDGWVLPRGGVVFVWEPEVRKHRAA